MDESITGAGPAFTPELYVRAFTARLVTKAIALDPGAPYEDALDRVQETFTRIFKVWNEKAEDICDAGIAYAFTVLRNIVKDEWKSARYQHESPGLEPCLDVPTEQAQPDEMAIFSDLQREIWRAVATLDETQQEIVYLVYVERYSVVGAGRMIGLSSSTVHRYHRAALESLRSLMHDD